MTGMSSSHCKHLNLQGSFQKAKQTGSQKVLTKKSATTLYITKMTGITSGCKQDNLCTEAIFDYLSRF